MPVVRVPDMLVRLLHCAERIAADGSTLAEVMDDLFRREPALRAHVLDEDGVLRRYLLLLHRDVFVRRGDPLDAAVDDADEIRIMHSMAGGADAILGVATRGGAVR